MIDISAGVPTYYFPTVPVWHPSASVRLRQGASRGEGGAYIGQGGVPEQRFVSDDW